MRPWIWWPAVLAPILLIGGWTLAAARQPASYDAARDTISALAARGAVDAWIMTAAFYALGACYLLVAAGLGSVAPVGRALLALGGAATVAVAASPQPAAAHAPAATVAFVALAGWPAFAVPAGRWWSLVLLALLAWFATTLALDSLVGLSERAVAGAEALTPLAVVAASRVRVRRAGPG